MSRTSPITAAATAGPTPDTSVTVVPEAWTAAASRRLVSRRRASRRRRPARNSPASSRRAAWTAPAGWICSRRRAAAAARICLLTPPGTSSHSTACSRHTTWLRTRLRSRCRLARPVSTAAWSSARTGGQAADRSAATATERASSGSFLFTSPAPSSRTRAASLGCTSSTRSPAAASCRASRCPSPPAPPARPGPLRPGRPPRQQPLRLGHAGPHRHLVQRHLGLADHHRGMRPLMRVHPDHHCRHRLPLSTRAPAGPVAGMPDSRSISGRTSFEPRHGKGPAGWHIDIKPDHTGRQAVREPAHRAPSTLRTTPQRIQKQLDDMHRAGLS